MATPPPAPPRPTVGQRLRDEGMLGVGRSYLSDRWDGLVRRIAHRHMAPRISEFYRRAEVQTTVPETLLARVAGFPTQRFAALELEFREVAAGLAARYREGLPYPTVSAFSGPESLLVYAMVRGLGPGRVFETGVANGHSSYLILEALRRNGSGRLTSVDVRPDVGGLVPEELRGAWDLRLLPRRAPRPALEREFAAGPPIDLFIHDSDHSYRWQTLEFTLAWNRLSDRGLLASDDIDWSFAFLDFAARHGRRPSVLVSESKAFGLMAKLASP